MMSEGPENLALHYFRLIDERLDTIERKFDEVILRVGKLERQVAELQCDDPSTARQSRSPRYADRTPPRPRRRDRPPWRAAQAVSTSMARAWLRPTLPMRLYCAKLRPD
jgi:hypothetical protein